MSRELLILRHGKSDWDSHVPDYDRPLKNRGKRGAQQIGNWLWQQELRPDVIVSSPANRALMTAQRCCNAMGFATERIQHDDRIYAASQADLLSVLADVDRQFNRVMLVGHNPGLEELLIYLADSAPFSSDGKLLPTATLARLFMPNLWEHLKSSCAEIDQTVRARDLPDGFPYPAPAGNQIRKRPAYYYTQSAVIPYRQNGKRPHFLLIGSSSKQHWVVPKGIKDPGLSSQESASNEAWEEAGIRGRVSDELLGQFQIEKWGADCTVEVFAMEVSEIVEERNWPERHRGREWMDAEQAAKRLQQPELATLLLNLSTQLSNT